MPLRSPSKGISSFLLSALLLTFCLRAAGQSSQQLPSVPTHLITTTKPQLVDCAPVTLTPCMSMGFTAADSEGKPAPLALPPAGHLASLLTLESTSAPDNEVKPFYASAGEGPDAGQHVNVVLLMIDISGSMNDPSPDAPSRFAAVKDAVARYVNAMDDGSDQIAIVPFESHNVVSTIRSAVFSDHKADVLAQLNALPAPGPKNNTALYQAVFSGIDALRGEVASLEREGHAAAELQPHLLVMTDGKNEVMAGDDPQLLNGPLGLEQAYAQVAGSHLDVVGVGFGDRAAIDAAALRRLSSRFFYATDAEQLLAALHMTRTEKSHVIQVTWLLPEANRLALAGRDQVWTPRMTLESGDARLNGTVLRGEPVRILMPAMAAPVLDRKALQPELVALIAVHPPASSGWLTVLLHVLLFLSAAALLLVLWFWVPRLVWGDRFSDAAPSPRWRGERQGLTAASGVQIRSTSLPAGFHPESETSSALQRSPAQTTQVGPRPEATRTRLNFD